MKLPCFLPLFPDCLGFGEGGEKLDDERWPMVSQGITALKPLNLFSIYTILDIVAKHFAKLHKILTKTCSISSVCF